MIEYNRKGYREILMHRMFLAIISNIVLQFFLVSCLILITNTSTNIASWLQDTWETITSLRMWIYFSIFAFITFLQGIIYSKSYLHCPPYLKNRFFKLQKVFAAQNLLREWIPFQIQQNNVFGTNNPSITLADTLSMENIPIMQHLGYLDLITLAQKQKERRGMLFTLSQPGGHPYNWNCIIEKCLGTIKKFSDEINGVTLKSKEQQLPTTSMITNLTMSHMSAFQSEHSYMRNLVKEMTPSINESCACKPPENEFFIYKYIKTKKDMLITYFLSKPLIYYVFGEQEDTKVQYALFKAQAVIWAAEAISSLSVVSLKEDSYGIVQKDLPVIINTLLALKHSLDKLQKSNILTKKFQSNDRSVKRIFTSLRNASKRSLYKVTTGFEDYINDLTLETAIMEQLQPFLNYKE